MSQPFTYDPTTERGKVRLLIDDRDTSTPANQFFIDAEIDAFLSLEDNDIWRAAAAALDTIAGSEAMVQKAISIGDLSTNGPAVAAALRDLAQQYRTRSVEGAPDDVGFDIAEHADDDFSYRERIWKQMLREGDV